MPDEAAQGGMVCIFMGYLVIVATISFFEIFSNTSIGFPTCVALPGKVCFVHHIICVALSWHGACGFDLAVAVEALFELWMLLMDFIHKDLVVMPGDVFFDIGHGPIRDFDGIRVTNFVEDVILIIR